MEYIWKFGSKNVAFLTSRMFASSMIRGLSKRGRDTESDANTQLEEMLTFFSNEYSICISIRNRKA